MFGFSKVDIPEMDINEFYDLTEKDDAYMMISVDEFKDYEPVHAAGSDNIPERIINQIKELYPEKDDYYGFYSLNKEKTKIACKKVIKMGYKHVYNLGSFVDFNRDEEGYNAKKNRKQRRNRKRA